MLDDLGIGDDSQNQTEDEVIPLPMVTGAILKKVSFVKQINQSIEQGINEPIKAIKSINQCIDCSILFEALSTFPMMT
jgi:hypothetical protein